MAAYRGPGSRNDPVGLMVVAHQEGATVSIQLHGECDLAGVPSIREAISRALDAGPECIVLDLSRLRFIDSSGLHATIELTKRSAAQNTRVVIIPGPPPVQRIFEITGVLEKLPFIGKLPNGSVVARRRWSSGVGQGS